MIEGADLPRLLRRIRRRARVLASLEGAALGGALGAGGLAAALAAARAFGAARPHPGRAAMGVALAALLGAALAGARRITLARCARLLDAALDRGAPPRDRVLSALAFMDGPDTPLARAAIADAVARARAIAPGLAAPARRPRRLPAFAGAALALTLVAAWPAPAPGARSGGASVTPLAPARPPAVHVAPHALDAERAEARAVADAAAATGDVRLAKLAAELHATLDALAKGELDAGEALDRLAELARRAREAGEEAAEARAALDAARKAFEPTAETRGLGRALASDDAAAVEGALRALAARAGEAGERSNEGVARAFDAAAASLGGPGTETGDGAGDGETPQRRLAQDRDSKAGAPGSSDGAPRPPAERRLERLRRDLEETASACRGDAASCARRLQDRADDFGRLQRDARGAEAQRRLESAARQARERLRRGDLERAPGGGERRFLRAARGDGAGREGAGEDSGREGAPGERAPGGARGAGASAEGAIIEAEGGDDTFADPSGGASVAGSEGEDGPASTGGDGEPGGAAAQGQGAGHEPGGEPLGASSMSSSPSHGREREARVRSGAGPKRSEVIESAARRGFATSEYGRVFGDYEPVVEESLASGAVPEGRRYLVRRYFQLIRPRAARRGP